MEKENPTCRRRTVTSPLSLRAIMQSMDISREEIERMMCPAAPVAAKTAAVGTGEVDEAGGPGLMDSADAAKAFVHMAYREGLRLNVSQVLMLLYIAYGVWLATRGGRLLQEHPQAWQFGPAFPRAYRRLKRGYDDGALVFGQLMDSHPVEMAFLSRCFQRFGRTRANILALQHTSDGSPWKAALRESGGKYGVPIPDELIRGWFSRRV